MMYEHKLLSATKCEADMHVKNDGSSYVPQEFADERETLNSSCVGHPPFSDRLPAGKCEGKSRPAMSEDL